MASPYTAKPASGLSAEPVSKSEQLGSGLDLTNNPKPVRLQAPDDTGESNLKLTLAKWIEQVALDPSVSLYDFRVAQRLCSKVRDESLNTRIAKLRSKTDSASLTLLVERRHLIELKIEIGNTFAKRCTLFCLAFGEVRI